MIVDLLVIGGGINGAGIAADAAGRGLSVILCEKNDLAFGTSSSSSNLIHGGLRYLEQYNFKLVHKALKEREILMAKAPFLIRPIEFILPHNKSLRPKYIIQLGLWLYDHLYVKRTLPRSKRLNIGSTSDSNALRSEYKTGFSYADCQTNDARLVVLNAMAAREHGAHILTRTKCKSLQRYNDHWIAQLHDTTNNQQITVTAKIVVNAAGPWVSDVMSNVAQITPTSRARLVQGSHIVVPKLYEGKHAYTLQQSDGRVVFAIPYQNRFTLIGTTDIPYEGDANSAEITTTEIQYLCDTINQYFINHIASEDIVWSYSGVRALFDDHANGVSTMSRDYHIDLNVDNNQAPLLSILGGKLTTYRVLAENTLTLLTPFFPTIGPPWTEHATLPGGKCDGLNFSDFTQSLEKKYSFLPMPLLHRYAAFYGERCHRFLMDCQSLDDLGRHFGAGLYEKEVQYLMQNEWAQTADDILWRRTKLGLYLTPSDIKALEAYF